MFPDDVKRWREYQEGDYQSWDRTGDLVVLASDFDKLLAMYREDGKALAKLAKRYGYDRIDLDELIRE